jgi:hypothetical protein
MCDEEKGIIRIKQEGKTKKEKGNPRMGEGREVLLSMEMFPSPREILPKT